MHICIYAWKTSDILSSAVVCLIGKQTLYKIFKRPLVFLIQWERQLTDLNNEKKKGGRERRMLCYNLFTQ